MCFVVDKTENKLKKQSSLRHLCLYSAQVGFTFAAQNE